jgi:hypothetical protein
MEDFMARRAVTAALNARARGQDKSLTSKTSSSVNTKKLARNVGIGVGAFFLVRYAIRYYKAHPEISEFIQENIETAEEKLKEYKAALTNEESSTARH